MKIALLFLLMIAGNVLSAQYSRGQDLTKVLVTVDLKNATLKKAFKEIESLSDFSFYL